MNIEQILNATLAGGIMVGACADMLVSPFISLILGACGGVVSTLGFKFLENLLEKVFKLHDTCGIAYLHFIPGLIGGLVGCLVAGVTPEEKYGNDLFTMFPMMGIDRGNSKQGGIQVAHVFTTFGIALLSGTFTGLVLRIPFIWNCPIDLFHDEAFFSFKDGDHDAKIILDDNEPIEKVEAG